MKTVGLMEGSDQKHLTNRRMTNAIKCSFLLLITLCFPCFSLAQSTDSETKSTYLGGTVTLTTNGTSTIPNLTLGRPAVMFAMSMGRKLRFEPEFRFAIDGKPWTFILWGRYELINTEKLRIRSGLNTAVNFKTVSATTSDFTDDILWARHALTGDLAITYMITKNISLGPYYMYIYNFDRNITRNTHLIALRSGFSNIRISSEFFLRFNPQVYYLKMDENGGIYFNSTLALARRDFPLSVSALINKTIQTEIPLGDDFSWSLSLIYTFNKEFVEK